MRSSRVWMGKPLVAGGLLLFVAACNNPGATTTSQHSESAGAGSQHEGTNGGTPWTAEQALAATDSFAPEGAVATIGGSGGLGGMQGPPGPPYGTSTTCGDGIVGLNEECDDGDDGSDACTQLCETRDQAAVAPIPNMPIDRYLGAGRHPVSGLAHGFITTYVEQAENEPNIGATLFDIWGRAQHRLNVSEGAFPIDDANPVAAALPDGGYAVAWSDFDGDGSDLGVLVRRLQADGSLGAARAANAGAEFSQRNPDMVWTGTQLIVAWEDYSDAVNGPDLRFRSFDENLNPTSGDVTLAAGISPEASVALAAFDGTWAAAYREGALGGRENVVVRIGQSSFRIGPVQGGPLDDRPALVGLDATHWLVAFSVGTDPTSTGVYNLPRLRYALIDTASAEAPPIQSLDPLDVVYTFTNQVAQMSPSLERRGEDGAGVYLAWRSETRAGDASGDQIWLKLLRWAQEGSTHRIRAEETELLIPRTCDGAFGDQRAPALGRTSLPPSDALAIAWTDYGRGGGTGSGEPDVIIHYAPTHLADVPATPQRIVETWSGPTGSNWPGRWSSDAVPPIKFSVQSGQGEFHAPAQPGSALAWLGDHTARDVDIVTTVRLNNDSQTIGVFARRADDNPNSYVAGLISSTKVDVWRTYRVAPDPITGLPVATTLQSIPVPKGFFHETIGKEVDHRLRFQVTTSSVGTVFVRMKAWRLGADEPTAWLFESQHLASSTLALQLANTAGRFGVFANTPTANGGRVWFDDFSATFFEGNAGGDPTAAPLSIPLLLPRTAATYRHCSEQNRCGQADGCCSASQDCAAGLACDRGSGEAFGVGSNASTCVATHCVNLEKDAAEVRADCGGADCKPCDCSSTSVLGAAGYCSPSCNCGTGEYPCSRDGDCLAGLLCGANSGEPFGAAWDANACVPPHCVNRILDAALGETAPDCGGECGDDCTCSQPNGLWMHCRPYCPCNIGEAHCLNDQDCAAPLECGVAKGPRYGFGAGISICLPTHCLNNVKEVALGETSTDCGGDCGCGGCPAGCL
jgi:hypothetical protein